MSDKNFQDINLEDIMKEFGGGSEPEEDVKIYGQPDDVKIYSPTEAAAQEETVRLDHIPDMGTHQEETVRLDNIPDMGTNQEDTVRLDHIPSMGTEQEDTVRLDHIPEASGILREAQHIDDEEAPFVPPQPAGKAEPYTEAWEPEYEQPISEYVPTQPIPFPARSRLRDLKKKLVAGPERLYYKLSEQSGGRLQLAIFVNLLVLVLTAVGTVLFERGVIGENRLRLMVFVQFFCMLFAALMGSEQLVEGFADLVRKRFSLNTMLLFTFLLCCADGVMGLYEKRISCCAAFSLQMTMSLWSAHHVRNTKLGELDTMRKATRLDSLVTVDDYLDNAKGILRSEGQVEDFMDNFEQPSKLEKVVSIYAIVAFGLSVAAGIAAGILHGVSAGVQVAAVTTLAAIPASMHVFLSRPKSILERKLHDMGAVLCGWQGVEGLCGNVAFPIDHRDLFPSGTAKMNGVKFFGSRQPDQVVAYAAALIGADDGVLAPLFAELLENRNGKHYSAERLTAYESGGIGAIVNGEQVLAGSLSFLKGRGVEVPENLRVKNAVCVAVNDEFSGLFAISYEKNRMSAASLTSLCGYRGVTPVLVGGRFVLTEKFIYDRFGVNPKRIHFADPETRVALARKKPQEDAPALALITGKGVAPFVYATTGARTLKSAAKLGLIVHMIGGILGMAMMIVLAVLGATHLLEPLNLFFYELVWLVPGLLITEWTRTI